MSRNKVNQFYKQELPEVRVDPELLAHLESVFPNRLPSNPLEKAEDYSFLIGQQTVVKYIKRLYEKKP